MGEVRVRRSTFSGNRERCMVDCFVIRGLTVNQRKLTARVETTTEVTSEERASARRNRDVLTLLSEKDRQRFAGEYTVVVRNGSSSGMVIGHGATQTAAVRMAQSHPEYDRINCAVQYVSTSPVHHVDGVPA
jgi:hypothetical protein